MPMSRSPRNIITSVLDGRGYPDGLYDRSIPYIAKVVNLADSFDAMTTDRPV
jgi:HD-GYP domain-containing protein (c-di-GMP phosphodiesterase class II)